MALKRIVYCGNLPSVADELIIDKNLEVAGIVLQKGTLTNEMVHLALLRSIPIVEVSSKAELESKCLEFKDLDALVICGFGIILSASLLKKIDAYNFHPGVLPDFKGRHPTFFATVAGELTIGLTLHEVTPEIDAGKILGVERIPYGFKETENDLFLKYPAAVKSLLPTLISALNGNDFGVKNQGGTYYQPVSESDKTFTKNSSPSEVLNIIRAQSRYGGGIFSYKGKSYQVSSVEIAEPLEEWNIDGSVFIHDTVPIGLKVDYEKVIRFNDVKLLK